MKSVEVKNLFFSYDGTKDTIEDVSFDIEKGSYTTIIGHNGSGKSTIAKLLIGLLEKKSGSIKIEGLELNLENIQKIRGLIGIVFQNPDNQFIGSTVRDDIAFGLENHCVPQQAMDPIIDEFSKRVHMEAFLDSEPTKLSGGQKQRVAIAGVLAMKPDIIIFDESTSMLDPQGKDEIKKVIYELHKESELTIISITHDIEEVTISDHVIVLHDGHKLYDGSPKEILSGKYDLASIRLDYPFSIKLNKALASKGLKCDNVLQLEELVEEIWQYSLKK